MMMGKSTKKEQPEGKRVGLWIRVSTEDQARGESPEHHELRARGYAASRGWTVVEVYRLDGVSGKAVTAHPNRAHDEGRGARPYLALIFSKLARLGRNTRSCSNSPTSSSP